jgi:hypothetical protein
MLRTRFESDTGFVDLPAFFASISTLKTSLSVAEYLQVLLADPFPYVLVSAFDLDQLSELEGDKVRQQLNLAISAEKIVLFDSGNYESYWLRCGSWRPERFHSILRRFPCSFAFSFDGQGISDDPGAIADAVLVGLEADRKAADGIPVVPIIHGRSQVLPEAVALVAQKAEAAMVAIPERELGVGIVERAATLSLIRAKVDEAVAIHLLGTGNPLSILAYAMLGANAFDGLEWCQTAAEPTSGNLHHLSQAELFFDQGKFASSGLHAGVFALLSNLQFFAEWMAEVKTCLQGGEIAPGYRSLFLRAKQIIDQATKR